MNLPTELLLQVLQHLEKKELKYARLVCQHWSQCAAEHLFRRLYISRNRINLDVFQAVCQHAFLRKCVRNLEYDRALSERDAVSLSWYSDSVWLQYTQNLQRNQPPLTSLCDPEINTFHSLISNAIRRAQDSDTDHHEFQDITLEEAAQCESFNFVKKGYQFYLAQHELQKQLGDGFVPIFVDGLRRLDHLQVVTIGPNGKGFGHSAESPLARFCQSLPAWPQDALLFPPTFELYTTITKALSIAQKRVRHFITTSPVNADVDDTTPLYSESRLALSHYHQAYSGLKSLALAIEINHPYSDKSKPLGENGNLCGLLQLMTRLECLGLAFPQYHWYHKLTWWYDNDQPPWLPCSIIFPKKGMWPDLTCLNIENIAFSTAQFMSLILLQMPRLEYLKICEINLLDGHWDGIFEFLHRANILRKLDFGLSKRSRRGLYEKDQLILAHRSEGEDINHLIGMSEYVTDGLHATRHPSLQPGQPDEKSGDFLRDLLLLCGKTARVCAASDLTIRMKQLLEPRLQAENTLHRKVQKHQAMTEFCAKGW